MKNLALLTLLLVTVYFSDAQSFDATIDLDAKSISTNLQGFATSGMFNVTTYNWDGMTNPLTNNFSYQQIKELSPKILRFPSGGDAKFVRLLGEDPAMFSTIYDYNTGEHKATYGYGFDLNLIKDYLLDYYGLDPEALDDVSCPADVTDPDYIQDFCKWSKTVEDQNIEKHEPAIIQFKRMVKKLEAELGYSISIIYTLNIHTADPDYNYAVLDYLLGKSDLDGDGIPEDDSELNVVGVELGNEEYFGVPSLGGPSEWDNFDDYLNIDIDIEGDKGVMPFIEMIRENYGNTIQIGIPTAPPGIWSYMQNNCDGLPIYSSGQQIIFNNWNFAIASDDNSITITEGETGTYKMWDGLVIHPYVDEEVFHNSCAECSAFNFSNLSLSSNPPTSVFTKIKTDIANFFIKSPQDDCENCTHIMISEHVPSGNYCGFYGLLDYYKDISFNGSPKLWLTEWNFNPRDVPDPASCEPTAAQVQCGANTLIQGLFIQRWMHEMYEASETYDDFIQYATVHNLVGTSTQTNLISKNKNTQDFETSTQGTDALEEGPAGSETVTTVNLNRRTVYYPFSFSKSIKTDNLLLAEVTTDPTDVAGLTLHGYISSLLGAPGKKKRYLYLYFENTSSSSLNLDFTSDVHIICPDCIAFDFTNIYKSYVTAPKLYTTAGHSQLYYYSDYYFDDCDVVDANIPSFEINNSLVVSAPSEIVSIPKYSFGVIVATLKLTFAKMDGEVETATISSFPNPFDNSMTFFIGNIFEIGYNYSIIITNATGQFVDKIPTVSSEEIIYEKDLPAGVYFYQLLKDSNQIATGKFIKQ